jgi:hypothetical protein
MSSSDVATGNKENKTVGTQPSAPPTVLHSVVFIRVFEAISQKKVSEKVFPEMMLGQRGQSYTQHDRLRRKEVIFMGYSKRETVSRDPVSGLFVQNDLESGEVSVDQLNARMAARQGAINTAIQADWKDQSVNSPAYGDSMSKQPRPSDAVANSKAKHYGAE